MMKNLIKIFLTVIVVNAFLFSSAFSEENTLPQFVRSKTYNTRFTARVVDKIDLKKGYHEGLLCEGKNVWVNNGKGGNTWIVDTIKAEIVSEIKPAGKFTEAIISAGEDLYWVTDWEDKALYKVNIENGEMKKIDEISLAPAHPAGLEKIKDKIYVITWTRGIGGTKYHLVEIGDDNSATQVVQITGIYEPAHMAWDGENLWITSWYSQLVYRVAPDTFTILDAFKSPAEDSTGITWDGKYLWITGTYADLYKVKTGKDDNSPAVWK